MGQYGFVPSCRLAGSDDGKNASNRARLRRSMGGLSSEPKFVRLSVGGFDIPTVEQDAIYDFMVGVQHERSTTAYIYTRANTASDNTGLRLYQRWRPGSTVITSATAAEFIAESDITSKSYTVGSLTGVYVKAEGDATSEVVGVDVITDGDNTADVYGARIIGGSAPTYPNVAASITGAFVAADAWTNATFPVCTAIDAQVRPRNAGTQITDAYGVKVSITGSVTTAYAVHCAHNADAGTEYGIYSECDDNYFSGNVGIGRIPQAKLDVNGTIVTDVSGYGTLRGGTTSLIIDAGSGFAAMEFKRNNSQIILNPNSRSYDTHIYSSSGQTFLIQGSTGHAMLALDNAKFLWGAGQDASIYYDGTDLVFNSREVGTGNFRFLNGAVICTNTGLHLLDTDASHSLIVKPDSNLTANRTLSIKTGDQDRTLDFTDGSLDYSVVTKTTDYAAAVSDDCILVDATTAAVTVTMPPAANMVNPITIKKIDSTANGVTIDGNAAETIDGSTTLSLLLQYAAVTLASDGTSLFVIGRA